jgi:NAD(P)-dependent dehydrogenase (short-subunit alcohol dehydrogenase family)
MLTTKLGRLSFAAAAFAASAAFVRTNPNLERLVMPSLKEVQDRHASVNLVGKNAIVVGGTSGIGMGVAVRLAQAGAAVTLVGRDPNRAAEIVAQMNAAAPAGSSPQHSFVACDCFQLANVATCAAQLTAASASGKLDFLVLTQGMATTQGRTDTPDGLDQKLTLHYFSRVAFAKHLAPMLEKAEPGGRVLSVLSAGVHGTYAGWKDDTGLSAANYSLKNAADAAGFYNDIAMEKLAQEHPTLSFTHAAPGFV